MTGAERDTCAQRTRYGRPQTVVAFLYDSPKWAISTPEPSNAYYWDIEHYGVAFLLRRSEERGWYLEERGSNAIVSGLHLAQTRVSEAKALYRAMEYIAGLREHREQRGVAWEPRG
jgi:hypothetical protein